MRRGWGKEDDRDAPGTLRGGSFWGGHEEDAGPRPIDHERKKCGVVQISLEVVMTTDALPQVQV